MPHNRRTVLAGILGLPLFAVSCGAQLARQSTLRISLAGQALMTHPLCVEPYDGFDEVLAELGRGDIVFTDLEVAIKTSRSGAPTRDTQFLHVADPDVLDCLKVMGFNLLALSNNHAWDLGTEGVLATRAAVAQAGFVAAGTGRNRQEASSAATIQVDNMRVALVAMATEKIRDGAAATDSRAGVCELRLLHSAPHPEDASRVLRSIAHANKTADLVIAYHHNHDWGEDMRVTRPWALEWAAECADAGADIYVSHGAPLLHGIRAHDKSVLLFGLGSLVFHSITAVGHYPPQVWESAIVHCDYRQGQLNSLEVIPILLNEFGDDPARQNATRGRPRIARGEDAARILDRLRGKSAELGVTLRIEGARGYLRDFDSS